MTRTLKVIGLMSGTSLDGLDICYVEFVHEAGKWEYSIKAATTREYPERLKDKLASAQSMTALEYAKLHSDFGLYLGKEVADFIREKDIHPDIIASHGQTIFHQPQDRFTAQIGSGAGIAAETGIDCVCDFRTTDVALGGQGAPLVPIGDRTLFGDYEFCLNLGGFSNISFDKDGQREAFDICPVNYVLNHYTRKIGKEFDRDGEMAGRGRICQPLLDGLNSLPFYGATGPKSLGREWVEKEVFPLIDSFSLEINDILATFTEHIAIQIAATVAPVSKEGDKVLVTGGGALNKYLIERMGANIKKVSYVIPDQLTINFKEALIFALLGALYMEDMHSCLKSVTGASRDNTGGCLYKAR